MSSANFVHLLAICFLAVQFIVAGQAPGDEDELCTVSLPSLGQNVFNDPPNVKPLMDSSHYEYLLPPNANPVWQRLNLDGNNGGGGTTEWTEHGGQCTSRVIACGYEQGPQDNWLITQHINRNVDGALLPQVTVQFNYQQSCPTDSTACQRAFDVFVYERSTIDPIAARNSSNFVLITRLSTPSQTQALIVDINFNTQESGFYLAIRDQDTCITFSRVLVFYYVCPAETVYLVERPETISPALQVTASCVDGASPVDGNVVIVTCIQQGLWFSSNGGCKCNGGSVPSSNHEECIKCEAGFYASASLNMCLLCPNNSNSTQPGMTECACDDGYYRTKGEVDQPCTRIPVINDPPVDQFEVDDGSSAVFSCGVLAFSQLDVSWTFTNFCGDTTELSNSSKHIIISNTNNDPKFGQLTVKNAEYRDRGVYTCIAQNDEGFVSANASLTVHVTPFVVDSSNLTEVNSGSSAVLACLATGFPVPYITWMKNGETVRIYDNTSLTFRLDIITRKYDPSENQSNNGSLLSSGNTGSGSIMDLLVMYADVTVDQVLGLGELGIVGLLSFNKTQRNDTANYTCTATNMLPQTAILMAVSGNIPLVILDPPDPPFDITVLMTGARWAALRWTLNFGGNRPVITFSLYYRTVNKSDDFSLISSLNAADLMTSEGQFMYNVSNRLIVPFTNYSFAVVSCNEIGCSELSDLSPLVKTKEDASSPPIKPEGVPGQNEIVLTWTQPAMPNGIIRHYQVSYSGSRAFDSDFEHISNLPLSLAELTSPSTGQFQTIVTGLSPNTHYDITVVAVNGAGDGNPANLSVTTENAPPAPPTNEPSIADAISADPRTITISTIEFSEANGPISHYQIITVYLPQGTKIEELRDPGTEFPQSMIQTQANISCDSLPNTPLAYISAEMSSDLYRGLPSRLFVIGQDIDDHSNSPNDRPALYNNGQLCSSSDYTFFIRAFSASVNLIGHGSARQTNGRQYNLSVSSAYIPSISIECGATFLIQLRLIGIIETCLEWVADNGHEKLDTLSGELINNIESRCQCGFSIANLIEPRFRCYTESVDAVTYRVPICSSYSHTAIVSHINEWLMQGALVGFDFILIPVDASCPVVISSIQDPECAKASSAVVGGAIGSLIVLLLVVTVLLVVIFLLWKHRKNRRATLETPKSKSDSGIEEVQDAEYEELDDFMLHTITFNDGVLPPALPSRPPPSVPHVHGPTAEYEVPVANSQQAAPDIDCADNAAYALS